MANPAPPYNPIRGLQQLLAFNNSYTGPINGTLDKNTLDSVYAYNKLQKNNIDAQISIGEDEQGNPQLVSLPTNPGNGFTETSPTDPSSLGTFTYEKKLRPLIDTPAPITRTYPSRLSPILKDVVPDTFMGENSTPPPPEPETKYNWLSPGNIADAARTYLGYRQATRPLPENPINPDYLKLVSEAKVQAGEGLGPASRQLYNNQIDDSRSLGIDYLRNTTGGGGSAGAAIAGLDRINNEASDAALKLAAANEQAGIYQQNRYQSLLGGLIDQQQQRFGMGYNAALANKQAGLTLAQQGLAGIQNRYNVWNLYDNPKSPLARHTALQVLNMDADNRTTKTNYLNTGKLLTNTK